MLAPDGSGIEVPDDLKPLSWLIGRWVGVGTGQYPTIEDFRFGQEVSFITDGRPFLSYASRSWLLDDDGEKVRPLALETGFWRPRPDGEVEVTLAHPTGYSELWLGTHEVLGIEDVEIVRMNANVAMSALIAGDAQRTAECMGYLLTVQGQPLRKPDNTCSRKGRDRIFIAPRLGSHYCYRIT